MSPGSITLKKALYRVKSFVASLNIFCQKLNSYIFDQMSNCIRITCGLKTQIEYKNCKSDMIVFVFKKAVRVGINLNTKKLVEGWL